MILKILENVEEKTYRPTDFSVCVLTRTPGFLYEEGGVKLVCYFYYFPHICSFLPPSIQQY